MNFLANFVEYATDNPIYAIVIVAVFLYVLDKILRISWFYLLCRKIKEKLSEKQDNNSQRNITNKERMERNKKYAEMMRKNPNIKF
jgi:hypothetical protein